MTRFQALLLCSVIILSSTVVSPVNAQTCLPNLPPFNDPGNTAPLVDYQTQVIVTSYQFKCCGEVTEWGAFVQPGGSLDNGEYSIRFQVWRPSGQCYSTVGQNEFTSVSLNPNSVIRETPIDRIQVQPGDVIGFYLDSPRRVDRGGRGVQLDANRNQEEVWYGDIGSEGSCAFSVGDITLQSTNLAPILHVVVSTTECLVSTSTTVRHITTTPYVPTNVATSLDVRDSTSTTVRHITTTPYVPTNVATSLVVRDSTSSTHYSTVLGDHMHTTHTCSTIDKTTTIAASPNVLPTSHHHTTLLPSNTNKVPEHMPSISQTLHNTSIPAIPTQTDQLHIILPVLLSTLGVSIFLIVLGGVWVNCRKKRRTWRSRRNNHLMMSMSEMDQPQFQEKSEEKTTTFVNVEPYAMREDWDTSAGKTDLGSNRSLSTDNLVEACAIKPFAFSTTLREMSQSANDLETKENIAYGNHKRSRDSGILTSSNQAYTSGNEGASQNIPTTHNEAYHSSSRPNEHPQEIYYSSSTQEPIYNSVEDVCQDHDLPTTHNEAYHSSLRPNEHQEIYYSSSTQEPIYNSVEDVCQDHDYSYLEYEDESQTYDYTRESDHDKRSNAEGSNSHEQDTLPYQELRELQDGQETARENYDLITIHTSGEEPILRTKESISSNEDLINDDPEEN